jgi:hypothetical protein
MNVQVALERGRRRGIKMPTKNTTVPGSAHERRASGPRAVMLPVAIAVGAALALSVAAVSGARAAYVVTFLEVGADVVATGGGSLDLAGFPHDPDKRRGVAAVDGSIGAEVTGPASLTFFDQYVGATGPSKYGGGGMFKADEGSGDIVGVEGSTNPKNPSDGGVAVPDGYRSGDPLSDASIYLDQTFATLGIVEGTYIYRFGAGANADSFTVQIGPAVPEPASWALLAVGFASLRVARRLFCRCLRLRVSQVSASTDCLSAIVPA